MFHGMSTYLILCRLCALCCGLFLTACSGVPDCDGSEAQKLMTETVFALAKSDFSDVGSMPDSRSVELKPSLEIDDRHSALNDRYFPSLAMEYDLMWLAPRILQLVPDDQKEYGRSLLLGLHDYEILRRAIQVRLTDFEELPDRNEDGRIYKKVCRAKLWITPKLDHPPQPTPVTVIYSLNPPPRASKLHGANHFYVAVNFFDAEEPALPFEPSSGEKLTLMMFGATKGMDAVPKKQSPEMIIERRALRATRLYYQAYFDQDNK